MSGVENEDAGDMACVDAARRRFAEEEEEEDDDETTFAARHGAGRQRLGADDSADISMMVAVSEDADVSGAFFDGASFASALASSLTTTPIASAIASAAPTG